MCSLVWSKKLLVCAQLMNRFSGVHVCIYSCLHGKFACRTFHCTCGLYVLWLVCIAHAYILCTLHTYILQYIVNMCIHSVVYFFQFCIVKIITPPENTTVCRGSTVTISCEYQCANPSLPVTWIINGTSFTQEQHIMNHPLYYMSDPTNPKTTSITRSYFIDTTTLQCIVQSTSSTISMLGTVTVTGGK